MTGVQTCALPISTLAARWMIANLEDSERGGFYDCATAPGLDGYPSERNKSPVDNSMAAATLIRLAQNTGRKDFEEAAGREIGRASCRERV